MRPFTFATLWMAILASGALFGFYFTMSVSIMPGFDATVPYAALQANQDVGRATQQSAFFVALLGAPLALIIAIVLTRKESAVWGWLAVSLVAWAAMMTVTLLGNVPLNQMLDGQTIDAGAPGLAEAWRAYSEPWQFWNWLRVATMAIGLLAVAHAYRQMP